MLAMAERGDNTNVDMLVGDIYGGGYEKIGLKATTIASSFGKVFKKQTEAEKEAAPTNGTSTNGASTNEALANGASARGNTSYGTPTQGPAKSRFAPEDISRSLLYAIR